MVEFEEAKVTFPDQSYIYADVSQQQVDALAVNKWVANVQGKLCVATEVPVEELKDKLLTS